METTNNDHHQKETTSHHHIPTKLESLQTKLECLQHMTTCRPPWAKINKFMELQSKGRSPPAPPAEGTTTFETSRPTWVSDKDVALNKPKQGHKPNQSIPELSHFYTTQATTACLCTCCFVPCWRVTPWHKTTVHECRMLTSFCQLHKKKRSKTHVVTKKSLHQDMVCLFK